MSLAIRLIFLLLILALGSAQDNINITINWQQVAFTAHTQPTLQVVVNPELARGSKVHDSSWQALASLPTQFNRFVPWFPYPQMAVVSI
jgi:hypothetical protein